MPAVKRSRGLRAFWKVHRWIYRVSGGRVGGSLLGNQVIQLMTIGRKSGEPRTVMLNAFPDKGNYVVIGSNAGHRRHPLWYSNLRENPVASVIASGEQVAVMARDAIGEERERLWAKVTKVDTSYSEYQERTERQIPVVILEPAESAARSPG